MTPLLLRLVVLLLEEEEMRAHNHSPVLLRRKTEEKVQVLTKIVCGGSSFYHPELLPQFVLEELKEVWSVYNLPLLQNYAKNTIRKNFNIFN